MKIIALFLSCLFCISAASQQPRFVHYTAEEGLPSNEVYETVQDEQGYLWIATDGGVARFNGYNFEKFTIDEGLPENVVIDLFKDSKGRIWFVTLSKGICYWQNGAIHQYVYNDMLINKLGSSNVVHSFHVSIFDEVFITKHGGIVKIDSTGKAEENPFKEAYTDSSWIYLHSVENGFVYEFYIGTQSGDQKQTPYLHIDKPAVDFKLKKDQMTFLSTLKMLHSYHRWQTNTYVNLGRVILELPDSTTPTNTIRSMDIADAALSMLKTDKYFFVGEGLKGVKLYRSFSNENKPEKVWLRGESIADIYQDKDGGLWFSSLLNGLYYLPKEAVYNYTNEEKGLSGSSILDMEADNEGNIYIVYRDVKAAYDVLQNNGDLNRHKLELATYQTITGLTKIGDTIFIKNNTDSDPDDLKDPIFLSLQKLDNGRYLGRMRNGFIFPWKKGSGYIFFSKLFSSVLLISPPEERNISNKQRLRVNDARSDINNNVWIVANEGLWQFKDSLIAQYDPDEPLLNIRFNSLEVQGQNLFMASNEQGIVFKADEAIWNISEKNGLASNKVNSIDFHQNTLWCGTSNGLSKIVFSSFSPPQYTIENYNKDDGLISNSINKILVIDSLVYVGTEKGLSVIRSGSLQPLITPPDIYITGIRTADSVIKQEFIHLNYSQNDISVSFLGLSYPSLGSINYKYRLKNLDDKWHYTRSLNAEYNYLPHGHYTFEVLAQNKDGVWSNKTASFSFAIKPPVWLSWWFISLFVLFTLGVVMSVSYWIILAQKRRSRLKLRIIRSEQMALQAQMNPHFMFNALNSIQSFNAKNEKKKAARYLSDFSSLIRKSLYNSASSRISLEEEIEVLRLYVELENMRMENSIEFQLQIDPELNIEELKIPPMILQPIIENAIWHGLSPKKGNCLMLKLQFSWLPSKESLLCVVQDNGVGRSSHINEGKSKDVHKSIGLKNIQDRISLLNSYYSNVFRLTIIDLFDEAQQPGGTRVEFSIHMTKNYR